MAEESFISISKLKKRISCIVCNEALFNPKDLPCKHSICCDCLDGLVAFQENGSGVLQCSQGCGKVVKIGTNDTVSSLLSTTNVTLELLSFLKEHKKTNNAFCQNKMQHCDEQACYSCSVCSKKICTCCWETHTCENKAYIPVIYDERKEAFKAVCKKHGSVAKSVCIDCGNQFLCIYCIHREHRDHYQDTIENQAGVTKNRLSTEVQDKIKTMRSPISYKEELNKIWELRKNLEEELEERIVKRLNQYAVLLNQQKETMLQTIDATVGEYEATLSKFGLIQEDLGETLSLYIEELNNKPSFEIIAEKEVIVHKSEILSSLHCFMASLSDYSDNEPTLGDLYVSNVKKNEIHEEEQIVELIYKKSFETDYQLIDDVSDLAKNIKDLELSIENTNKVIRRIKTHTYVFEDMLQLINADKTDELNSLLIYQPHTFLLIDDERKTLLHKAAEIGKIETLRLLLINSNTGNINARDGHGDTALIHASENGHQLCVELLLQHNADTNNQAANRYTALMYASSKGHEACVRLLLQHHADINVENKHGNTAMSLARTNKIREIITLYK